MSYDIGKWAANDLQERRRHPTTRWLMLGADLFAIIAAAGSTHAVAPPQVFALLLPAIVLAWTPFGRESFATGLTTFDEFERTALTRAAVRAYVTMFVAGIVAMALCAIATGAGWQMPTMYGWIAWCIAWLTIGLTLPALFAEFMVPIPPLGDLEPD